MPVAIDPANPTFGMYKAVWTKPLSLYPEYEIYVGSFSSYKPLPKWTSTLDGGTF